MSSPTRSRARQDSLSVKLGGWFEAHATGRGVLAVPVVVLIVAMVAAAKILFFR
jgi:hypothetical protein